LILVGDIGGTNTRLAMIDQHLKRVKCQQFSAYLSADYESLDEIIAEYLLSIHNTVESVCLAVAGYVSNGRCVTTNLPWVLDERDIADKLGFQTVRIINDLEAAAYGLLSLEEEVLINLTPDLVQAKTGNKALIAAGTGLGEAILYWDGKSYRPFATEGGHCDFAPVNLEQDDLLSWLRQRWTDHVSYERVLSGSGIIAIYDWVVESGRKPQSDIMKAISLDVDPAAVITHAALSNKDDAACKTLDTFVSIYAQEAANLVLKSLAVGGLYIGGGIAPKIIPYLNSKKFMDSFVNKGRFNNLINQVPVRVINDSTVAMLGAIFYLECEENNKD
jgi:glucokinase